MSSERHLFWFRLRYGLFLVIGLFFLVFGFQILVLAYDQTDPFSFVMTFFASNFIILFSLALIAGFAIRLYRSFRQLPVELSEDPSE